jgi:diguanylate cyclase (GGDEF)-like protein
VKVLIADDEIISRSVLEAMLRKWGHEVVCAADGLEAEKILHAENAPRLAILDWMMPGKDGVHLCRELRSWAGRPYTYVFVLTAKGDRAHLLQALDAGADDYLIKPFDPAELRARLKAGVRILELQDDLIAAKEQLLHEATHDALTGILNRRAVMSSIDREFARSERNKSAVGVILIDVDHFKQINDRYGHPTGDVVLKESAARFQRAVRPYDGLGRYGGEEFLVVLPGCDEQSTLDLAERLRHCISREPIHHGPIAVEATISLGAASFTGFGRARIQEAVKWVDEALYRAKQSGRNRVEWHRMEEA